MTPTPAIFRSPPFAVGRSCVALLACAALLGAAANSVRPKASRLPWRGNWDRHIETLAFRAGIPVVFLLGARSMAADPSVAVFDARSQAEYAKGHLPRAFSMPVAEIERRILDHVHRLRPDTPILAYCGSAECDDALELAKALRGLGFANVSLYPGGFDEWTAYGGAVRAGDQP